MLCLFYFESSWSLLKLADVEKVGRTETRGELGGVWGVVRLGPSDSPRVALNLMAPSRPERSSSAGASITCVLYWKDYRAQVHVWRCVRRPAGLCRGGTRALGRLMSNRGMEVFRSYGSFSFNQFNAGHNCAHQCHESQPSEITALPFWISEQWLNACFYDRDKLYVFFVCVCQISDVHSTHPTRFEWQTTERRFSKKPSSVSVWFSTCIPCHDLSLQQSLVLNDKSPRLASQTCFVSDLPDRTHTRLLCLTGAGLQVYVDTAWHSESSKDIVSSLCSPFRKLLFWRMYALCM